MDASKPLTSARAIALARLLCKHDDDRQLHALIELINGIADPHGDPDRYAAALEAMKDVFTRTPDFNRSFEEYLKSGPALDVNHSESENN